ncbi:MAG: type IX secretion system PorP/SprF family membrane protein [Parvicellaceae bacterium]|jgi:type IX secretion system PorP/SprF family membrane protein
MRKLAIIIIIGTALLGSKSYSQQLELTNLYNQNLFIVNPAFAGDHGYPIAHMFHRQQWTGVSGAPASSLFTIHSPLGEKNAIGAYISSDRAGLLERFSASGTYVYSVKINDDHKLGFGLSLGFYQNSINYSNIRIFDQTDDLVLNGGAITGSTFNADFGIRYSFKGLNIGISTPQIAETKINYNLINDEDGRFDLVRHYTANISYKFVIKEDWNVTPLVFARYANGVPVSFDASAIVDYKDKIWVGGGYRHGAGIMAYLGTKIANQLSAAYSYEFSGSGMASYSGGSHEIAIGYHFAGKKDDDKLKELEDRMNERFEQQQQLIDSLMNLVKSNTDKLIELEKKQADHEQEIKKLKSDIDELNLKLQNAKVDNSSPAFPPSLEDKYALSEEERKALRRHIQFGKNRGSALESSRSDMELIGGILKRHPTLTLRIVGHADNSGSNSTNTNLSRKRAGMVADFFKGLGVSESQILCLGKGSTEPMKPNDSEHNRELNRRVEFQIIEE